MCTWPGTKTQARKQSDIATNFSSVIPCLVCHNYVLEIDLDATTFYICMVGPLFFLYQIEIENSRTKANWIKAISSDIF